MSGVCKASGLKASGWEPKPGDDVGSEKASWVDERARPLWTLCDESSDVNSDVNHPIAVEN